MSGIVISYGGFIGTGLSEAADDAKKVSRRLSEYADALNDDVYRKLSNYAGERTENINSALNSLKGKITQLKDDSDKYTVYSADIDGLKDECQQVDRAVAARVEALTGEFKERNGIKTNTLLDNINLLLTKVKNSTFVGRWLDDASDWFKQADDYLKECIEDWYQFQGGKQFVKGATVAALELVAAVAGIVVTVAGIISGGWTIAAAAALIAGVIAGANAVINLINEGRALAEYGNDPAKAQRISSENSLQDTMRSESDENIALWDGLAGALDAVTIICAAVGLVTGIKDMAKGLKTWAGNDKIWTKIKTSVASGGRELQAAYRNRDFSGIKTALKTNMMGNFKKSYLEFGSTKEKFSSIKNWAGLTKTVFTDVMDMSCGEFGFDNIKDMLKICAANITVVEYGKINADGSPKIGSNGQQEKANISLSKITDSAKKMWSVPSDVIKLFSSSSSSVKVAVPEIQIPDIDVHVAMPSIKIDLAGMRSVVV